MGVLSDLVVAQDGDAGLILKATAPATQFGGIDIKGIDDIKFIALHAILLDRSCEELFHLYQPSGADDGPWVFRIPAELTARLAALQGIEQEQAADRWAAGEESAFAGWDATEVATALEAICAQARQAVDSRRSLFLWMTL